MPRVPNPNSLRQRGSLVHCRLDEGTLPLLQALSSLTEEPIPDLMRSLLREGADQAPFVPGRTIERDGRLDGAPGALQLVIYEIEAQSAARAKTNEIIEPIHIRTGAILPPLLPNITLGRQDQDADLLALGRSF